MKYPEYLNAAYEGDDLYTGDQLRAAVLAEREALLSLQAEAKSLRDQNTELDKQVAMLEKQLDNEYLMGFEGGVEACIRACNGVDLVGADECIAAIRAIGEKK